MCSLSKTILSECKIKLNIHASRRKNEIGRYISVGVSASTKIGQASKSLKMVRMLNNIKLKRIVSK
jgi:hypothetical protein